MNIHIFLKRKRLERGLKQKDLADALGYTSHQFISNWERGISTPPLASSKQICTILGIKPAAYKKLLVEDYQRRVDKFL